MKNKVDKFIKNPKKALFTLAAPVLVSMLVQSTYSIVDTAFVGRLGSDAIAALTFSFPIFFFIIALNLGLGTGTGSLISRYLGAKQKKAAENAAMHGIILSIILGLIVFMIGNFSLASLFKLFGAATSVTALASGYMKIILLGMVFMFLSFMLNSIFSAQGDTKTPMKIQVVALGINIILDPIFIYVLGWGVNGAAIATVNAFFISFLLYFFKARKRSYLHLGLSSFNFGFDKVRKILAVGFPASLMMMFMSIYSVFINKFMASFGTDYVASLGMVSRLESVTVMPIVAFSMASMTLAGMFYGAKRYDLLKGTIAHAIKLTVSFALFMSFVFLIFPKIFFYIFTSDPSLLNIASAYIRIHIFAFPFLAITMICSRALQGMGHGLPGMIANLVRVFVLVIPLAYLFTQVLGYSYLSIAIAIIVGAIVAAAIALTWFLVKVRKLNGKKNEKKA